MTKFFAFNKQIVLAIGMIVFVVAALIGGTGAFFSDTETSAGNVFTAGAVNISITDIVHTPTDTTSLVEFTESENGLAFSFADLKPLDKGTVTYTLDNRENPAYVCAMVEAKTNADNTVNDPEVDAGDVATSSVGELGQFLNFKFGTQSGSLAAISGLWQNVGPINTNATSGAAIDYCFGTFSGANCVLGTGAYNLAQTDSLTADIKFYAVQTRNNENFSCASLNTPTAPVVAASYATGFEPATFAVGTINGQNGWEKTGPFDAAIVSNPAIEGLQALRISNAVTSGSFGDQTFSPELAVGAGETGIAPAKRFEAEFKISSTQVAEQPGLAITLSPDDGIGSRMSFLRFSDSAAGIDVTFFDAINAGPTVGSPTTFNPTVVSTLSRATSHTVKVVMDFVDGPSNDVVKIYINGVLVHTGTSWENYYRYDAEQTGNGNALFAVDSLLFRASGIAAPATNGAGYLFDSLVLTTSN